MNIITGGTGHVGAALADELLNKGEEVTIVSRSSATAKVWIDKGAKFAVADIYDTSQQELKTVSSLMEALKYSRVEKVVALSVLGAQPGKDIGDLGVLYELEQQISKLSFPFSIVRAGYYMSNWLAQLKTVTEKGILMSFFPADLKIPMVSPEDIGKLAATLMLEENTQTLNLIEGPQLYSANDVAAAFSETLNKSVRVNVIPKEQWEQTYLSLGFSPEAAKSYTRMTAITVNGNFKMEGNSIKGKTSLQEYITKAVANE